MSPPSVSLQHPQISADRSAAALDKTAPVMYNCNRNVTCFALFVTALATDFFWQRRNNKVASNNNPDKRLFPDMKTGKTILCLFLVLALMITVSALSSQTCLAVSAEGGDAGTYAENPDILDELLRSDDSAASPDEGSSSAQADISAVLKRGTMPISTLRSKLLSILSGMCECWYLTVDDVPVARADSEEVLTDILKGIAAKYVEEDTSSVEFIQAVAVSYGLADEELENDPEAIAALLSPEGGCPLSVRTTKTSTEIVELPYETVCEESNEYYPFQSGAVAVEGQAGLAEITSEYVCVNGVYVATRTYSTSTVEPVNRVIVTGTREFEPGSTGTYIWPAQGIITSEFGYRTGGVGSSNHKGIDIAGSYGQEIRAADGGTVIYADTMSGYGLLVQISHENGDVTYYAHCSELLVSKGDEICQGEVIARMGATGVASGVHLHFEVRPGGTEPVDPMSVLP